MARDNTIDDVMEELEGLKKALRSTAKVAIRDSKDEAKTKKHLKITMGDYANAVDNGTTKMALLGKEIKENIPIIDKMGKKISAIPGPAGLVIGALKAIAKTIWSVVTATAKTALAFSDVTKSIDGLEDMIDQGFGEIPYVGPLLKEFGKEIDANVGHFKSLAKQGASFGSSIVEMRNLQKQSTMPLEKFTGLVGNNSEMMAKLFGTVDKGVPRIAGLTGKLRDITERDFAKFGLTLDDTSTYMTSYLELERARGNTQRMSQAQLLAGTAKYTKNLVTLSKLTGKSVDELDKQNMAMAADGVFQSQLTKMQGADAKTLSAAVGNLPGPLQTFAKEMIGLGAPISDTSKELQAMTGGRMGDAIKQFQQDLDVTKFQNAMKTISADTMKNSAAYGKAALAGGGFAEALNAMVTQIGTAVDPEELKGEMQAAQKDNIEQLVNLGSTLDRVKTAFEGARFDLLAPALYDNGETTVKVTGAINEKFTQLADEGLPAMTTSIKNLVSAATGSAPDPDGEKKGYWGRLWAAIKGVGGSGGAAKVEKGTDIVGANTYAFGTDGFKDFGRGTPAMLHGEEAVVPKTSLAGGLLSKLKGFGGMMDGDSFAKAIGAGGISDAVKAMSEAMKTGGGGGGGNMDVSQLVAVLNTNAENTAKAADSLNKLVAINMATERNTKNTNKELADMSGSLV